MGQIGRLFILAASLLPIALVVLVIVTDGVNAPFLDQWETSFRLAVSAFHLTNSHIVNPDSEVCYGQYLITHDDTLNCFEVSRMYYPAQWLPAIDVMAQRRLAMFNTPQLAVSLNNLPYTIIHGGFPEPSYTTYSGDGAPRPAFFEHTPALVEYALTLPEGYASAEFTASLYLDPTNILSDPATLQDGAIFSVIAIDVGEIRQSEPILFDPHVSTEPISFAFDLTDYIGQAVRLRLQTESGESVAYDWAVWIDPTIRLSD